MKTKPTMNEFNEVAIEDLYQWIKSRLLTDATKATDADVVRRLDAIMPDAVARRAEAEDAGRAPNLDIGWAHERADNALLEALSDDVRAAYQRLKDCCGAWWFS